MSEYVYFVSFLCKNAGGSAYGNTTITRDSSLDTAEKIRELESFISKENKASGVVLMNYRLLNKSEE